MGIAALPVGTHVGKYTVERYLGANQMATFYLARQAIMAREVVLKVLALEGELGRQLFLKEAQLLAALDHPGLVRVLDADEYKGVPYLVVEWVAGGRSVEELVAEHGRLDPVVAVGLAIDVADALAHMHSCGVAHRDVHPGNIIVSRRGRAVLVDLGIATPLGDFAAGMPGRSIGTPGFMSPEAWAGEPTTAAMDVWALGSALHVMVTGALPWGATEPDGLREEIVNGSPRISPTLPTALRALIERCIGRDHRERIREIDSLRRDLEGVSSYLDVGEAKTNIGELSNKASVLFVDVAYAEADVPGRFREFRVLETLGTGAFGEVVRAHDVFASREVALKLLRRELAWDPVIVRRFQREARVLARVAHPNLMRVYNFGEHPTRLFIVMELLRGVDLAKALETGPFEIERAVSVGLDILGGLGALHREGVVHRDVKPANIMLESGRAVVTDLGIAHLDGDETKLTRAGDVVGTPLYMAPEQARGEEATAATDVYAAGAVIFEMLAGSPPHQATTLPELLLRITTREAQRVTDLRPNVPAAVADVVSLFLTLDSKQRPQDAALAREALVASVSR